MKSSVSLTLMAALLLAGNATAAVNCPSTWLGRANHGHYAQDGYPVCDYSGSVSDDECDAVGAMETKGPHGTWCQKFTDNKRSLLLSLPRVATQP